MDIDQANARVSKALRHRKMYDVSVYVFGKKTRDEKRNDPDNANSDLLAHFRTTADRPTFAGPNDRISTE
jgi:hypothetical protein